MSILSPVGVCSFKLDCGYTIHGSECTRFLLRVPRIPAIIGPFWRTSKLPVFQSKSEWRRPLCSISLDQLALRATTESEHTSSLHGEPIYYDLEDTDEEFSNGPSLPELNDQLLGGSELASRRADPVRSRLIRKLSEANQYNRYLLREVQEREIAIDTCTSLISTLELELGVLVNIAQEIAREGGKKGTKKINGRYIHSYLACKLEDIQKSLVRSGSEIDGLRSREIDFHWSGMAEDVTVMGSFDGWSQGEPMSPESTGTFTNFSTTLKLRPGRYEIKFRVDGDWRLSPHLPTVGEGLMMNNLLIVQ